MSEIVSNKRIEDGFNILDEAMEKIVNTHHLNFLECLTICEMMTMKIRQNNISEFLFETVNRFQKNMNEEDERSR